MFPSMQVNVDLECRITQASQDQGRRSPVNAVRTRSIPHTRVQVKDSTSLRA
jgi:hypothetical protein